MDDGSAARPAIRDLTATMDDFASDFSSPLSSVPSSVPSSRHTSPLSVLSRSPTPPPGVHPCPGGKGGAPKPAAACAYLSPPASQQSSQSGSPVPDASLASVQAGDQEARPAKRRRTSKNEGMGEDSGLGTKDANGKERSPKYINIRDGEVEPGQEAALDALMKVLHKRQKIVVIAGAGISVSAGIPDFRSSKGLFNSLKIEHKLKGTGKDLFDASVYKDRGSTGIFQSMIQDLSRATKNAKPTAFHHMLATIASEGRLLRLYSQNVDGIDTSLEPLSTHVPLAKNQDGKWPRTVQLHGSLEKTVCSKCNALGDFDADLFNGSDPPSCGNCEEINYIRTKALGKRSHGIGRLRPRMVLYNEHNPDDEAIGSVTREDLRRRPDAVVVVGTTLKVPGVKRIVREMCSVVRDRRDGVSVWINNDLPPAQKEFQSCWDIMVRGSCDEIANKAAMRKWDDPVLDCESELISEEDAREALSRKAEVHLPRDAIQHLDVVDLPSDAHRNNSFRPPEFETPKNIRHCSPDWTPVTSRRNSSVIQSIEHRPEDEQDTIAIANITGLLTPHKSSKSATPDVTKNAQRSFSSMLQVLKPQSNLQNAKTPASGKASSKKGTTNKSTKPRRLPGSKAKSQLGKNVLTMSFGASKGEATPLITSKEMLKAESDVMFVASPNDVENA